MVLSHPPLLSFTQLCLKSQVSWTRNRFQFLKKRHSSPENKATEPSNSYSSVDGSASCMPYPWRWVQPGWHHFSLKPLYNWSIFWSDLTLEDSKHWYTGDSNHFTELALPKKPLMGLAIISVLLPDGWLMQGIETHPWPNSATVSYSFNIWCLISVHMERTRKRFRGGHMDLTSDFHLGD